MFVIGLIMWMTGRTTINAHKTFLKVLSFYEGAICVTVYKKRGEKTTADCSTSLIWDECSQMVQCVFILMYIRCIRMVYIQKKIICFVHSNSWNLKKREKGVETEYYRRGDAIKDQKKMLEKHFKIQKIRTFVHKNPFTSRYRKSQQCWSSTYIFQI